MDTLLHHIQPSIQKSIVEAKDLIEKRRDHVRERNIQEVHQLLDAFEQRVLTSPAPSIDLTTLRDAVASLRVDADSILEMRGPDPQIAPV